MAALAVAAVLANWVTTGDHLLKTVGDRYWPVAGVDVVLLAAAVAAGVAARRLGRTPSAAAAREVRADVPRTVARPAAEPAHV